MHCNLKHNLGILFCIFVALLVSGAHCFFDPVTLGIGTGIVALPFSYNKIKEYTYCRYTECCDDYSIPASAFALAASLHRKLFGQHIVKEQLVNALAAHVSKQNKPRKPLVISFQGPPGTGKNYVADQIAEALYTQGTKSKFVLKYMGRADFSLDDDVLQYKRRINTEVREAISACPRSLFIFDEVGKMPAGIFEALTSLVDYNRVLDGGDLNSAIFIFLSNTGDKHISNQLGKLIKAGTPREETKLSDFEPILKKAAYNLQGGMEKTSLIESHVIDHYIPFLPLEKSHVQKCIEAEFAHWGVRPKSETVESIISAAITYDREHSMFATTGCKTLDKKVAVEVAAQNKDSLRL